MLKLILYITNIININNLLYIVLKKIKNVFYWLIFCKKQGSPKRNKGSPKRITTISIRLYF